MQLVRDESEFPRVTRDIDLLVVAERMTAEFSAAFHAFLSAGGYSCYFSKNGKPHFYRFIKPRIEGYPDERAEGIAHYDRLHAAGLAAILAESVAGNA